MKLLKRIRFFRREDGPTSVEYAVMLALILIACMAAITLMGTAMRGVWMENNNSITNAVSS